MSPVGAEYAYLRLDVNVGNLNPWQPVMNKNNFSRDIGDIGPSLTKRWWLWSARLSLRQVYSSRFTEIRANCFPAKVEKTNINGSGLEKSRSGNIFAGSMSKPIGHCSRHSSCILATAANVGCH